jgi:hypothetical protein
MKLINNLKKVLLSEKKTIYPKEIPSKYIEGLTLLNPNAGNTSLAYTDSNKEWVYMFSRDVIKTEYLTVNFSTNKIGELIDEFYSKSHPLRDLPIYVIKMPFLYPLNTENKKIATQVTKAINYIKSKINFRSRDFTNEITLGIQDYLNEKYPDVDDLDDILDNDNSDKADIILYSLYNFFSNYSDFYYDIAVRQFKQTKDGKIVLLDPVASKDVVHYIQK